jgi:hypothetical protein
MLWFLYCNTAACVYSFVKIVVVGMSNCSTNYVDVYQSKCLLI